MGQDQPKSSSPTRKLSHSSKPKSNERTIFERNPRLVEQILFIPELFAGSIDADIKRVERLIDIMPVHTLQSDMIDAINERFLKVKTAKAPDVKIIGHQSPSKRSQPVIKTEQFPDQQTVLYFELQTQQRFFHLLKKIQHWFYIEQELNKSLKLGKKDKKTTTIRKKVLPNYDSVLNKHLFSKLFLRYYLIVLKKNFGSKDKERKQFMIQFHNSIGKMICEMIQYNHISDKKLVQLTYKIIYIEKIDTKSKLKQILNEIKQEFRPIYLTKEHSLILKHHEYDRIRQISRCYLDELYLRSLKEAEDPDIILDTNEGFGIVRNFPIARVREDKNR